MGRLSVRDMDTLVNRGLLEHIHRNCKISGSEEQRVRYSYRVTHVENIVHPTLLKQFNSAIKRFLEEGMLGKLTEACCDGADDLVEVCSFSLIYFRKHSVNHIMSLLL